jgi:hypothetical protein
MYNFSKLHNLFLSVIENLKGNRTFIEIKNNKDTSNSITCYSIAGYQLNIYCYKKQYIYKYDNWFVPTKKYTSYRIFCVPTNGTPDDLTKICELDITLPALLPSCSSDIQQCKAAVAAYVDILTEHLNENKFKVN